MTLSDGRTRAAGKKGNWVTRNLGLKLGALTLGVLLYSWVHGSEDVRRSVDVDILVLPPSDASGRILEATCTCAWSQKHGLTQGPCEHVLALRLGHMHRLEAEGA